MYMAYKNQMGSAASKISSKSSESEEKMEKKPVTPIKPVQHVAPVTTDQSDRATPDKRSSQAPKDLMISYSHADTAFMKKLRDKLEGNGISVWVDVAGLQAGVDFLSKIGQAIIDAKLFISIVSSSSVKSKYCKDELALAYISSSSIFPIALEPQEGLYPLMDTGMKLQLASYRWVNFVEEEKFDESMDELLAMLKDDLNQREEEEKKKEESQSIDAADKRKMYKRSQSRSNIYRKTKYHHSSLMDDETKLMPSNFWQDRFSRETVEWDKFVESLNKTFESHIKRMFSSEEDVKWLMEVLHREMEVEDSILNFNQLQGFCTVDGEVQPMWKRIEDQARESYAMKEVFDMDSSVRVEAIENLAKYRSFAVIQALQDLLGDPDANVRAVAAVSLARTEANDSQTINKLLRTLIDKDRLVREAGCLALGHLHSEEAVGKLLHMWRNDVISHVREAASVALQQIGGVEVEQAMHVTKVLADEIRQLTQDQ